jgi:hypothetical protein
MTEAMREQRRRLFFAEISRIVPGLYGWLATVLAPAVQRGASVGARVAAACALLALASSYAFSTSRPRVARVFGVYVFVASCFAAWALLGPLLRADQLDAVRAALGAVGFLLHALAWGAPPRDPETQPADNLVPGTPLQPRHKPVRLGAVVLGLGIAVALLPMVVAFGVERPGAALLAHASALGSGLLVIGASTDTALRVGKAHQFPAWRVRAARALWPIGGLIVTLALGLLWLALR